MRCNTLEFNNNNTENIIEETVDTSIESAADISVVDDFKPIQDGPVEKKRLHPFVYFLQKHGIFYLFMLPALLATLVFSYLPLPGLIFAFKEYSMGDNPNFLMAFFQNDKTVYWVGLEKIRDIFSNPTVVEAILNTLVINGLSLLIEFPMPIILALLLNEVQSIWFKKVAQTISYLPHFLSMASVLVIVMKLFTKDGIINDFMVSIDPTYVRTSILADETMFIPNYMMITIWKGVGWGSIIYLATLSSVSASLYEAAAIDGANKFQQMLHVTLPALASTISLLLILKMGSLLGSNFELVQGLSNPANPYMVISTYVYNQGLQGDNVPGATAVGFVQGVVSLVLVSAANKFSKWLSGTAIW